MVVALEIDVIDDRYKRSDRECLLCTHQVGPARLRTTSLDKALETNSQSEKYSWTYLVPSSLHCDVRNSVPVGTIRLNFEISV